MGIKSNKKFTVGIPYRKHLIKAKSTFEKVVLSQHMSNPKEIEKQVPKKQKLTLTPEQKAHLNCQSPI